MAEVTEAKAPEAKAEAAAPAKQKSALIPMLVAVVVMTGAGFATAKFAVVPMFQSHATEKEEGTAEENEARGEIITFENIIVNPSGTMGQRYLNATIGLEVNDEAAKEALQSGMPRIKDALITVLSARSIDELTDASNRESIRQAIMKKVNRQIEPGEVVAVYFLDFVLQ